MVVAEEKKLPRGTSAADDQAEKKVLREKKVAQRSRTRSLYDELDPLVPLSARPPMAEKGSLGSKRTFLQLQDDTVDHLRNLKAQRDGSGAPRDSSTKTPKSNTARGNKKVAAVSIEQGTADGHCELLAEGMLASTHLLLLELDTRGWLVLRASRGLRALYRYHPRRDGIVGECLLHYVAMDDAKLMRATVSTPGGCASEFEVHLRTWEHNYMGTSAFHVQRCGSNVPHRDVLILTPHKSSVHTSTAQDVGWSVAKMRDLCGVYSFDANRTTQAPWRTEMHLESVQPMDVNVGWFHVGVSQVLAVSGSLFLSRARELCFSVSWITGHVAKEKNFHTHSYPHTGTRTHARPLFHPACLPLSDTPTHRHSHATRHTAE